MSRTRLSRSPLILSLLLGGTAVACGEATEGPEMTGAAAGAGSTGTNTGAVPAGSGEGTGSAAPTDSAATGGAATTGTTNTGATGMTGAGTPGGSGVNTGGTGTGGTAVDTGTGTTGAGTGAGTGTDTGAGTGVGTGTDTGAGSGTEVPGDTGMVGETGGDMGDDSAVDVGAGSDDSAVDVGGGGDDSAVDVGAGGDCSFEIIEGGVSPAIGTVGIIRWSTTAAVQSAEIEFELADGSGTPLVAPVDLAEADYRTLLLGMKGGREYVYRIKVNDGACVSEDYPIETDPVPNSVPVVNRSGNGANAAKGFIITSSGLGNVGGGFGGGGFGGGGGSGSNMFIFDTDGDIVWWAAAPGNCSRAHMDWEGKNMWMTALNYPAGAGEMRYVSMDGLESQNNVPGLSDNHHDFTVAPGGIVTAILWSGGCNSIIERSPDGSIKTVVASVDTLYQPGMNECHANAITYQAADDTYVISDRNPNLFVRISRDGALMWQAGGNNPKGTHYAGNWSVNHGHHMLSNGNLLMFNNEQGTSSPVKELQLSGSTASVVWEYTGDGSTVLGDVQRLPNGNTLVTYSNRGRIQEVDASKTVVQEFTTDSLGYAMFRPTLYGPPPKGAD